MEDMEDVFREVRAHGGLAAAAQPPEESPLQGDGAFCFRAEAVLVCIQIIDTALDGDSGLPGCGDDLLETEFVEDQAFMATDFEAVEPGSGQQGGVCFAGGDFGEAGGDVSADVDEFGLRVDRRDLGASARAAGGDGRGFFAIAAENKDVIGPGAGEVSGDGEAFADSCGQVLRALWTARPA